MFATLLMGCLAFAPVDIDGDGYYRDEDDCDDARADIHPGAPEICDDLDNDCDGLLDDADPNIDWSTAVTMYTDSDGDGHGTGDQPVRTCFWREGLAETDGDCDDADHTVHPSSEELCGGVDEDCDGLFDEDDDSLNPASLLTWYRDADGDGYGDPDQTQDSCTQPAGYVAAGTDCNDSDIYQSPAAGEWVDGLDNDCDGLVDNNTVQFDDDGDCYCEEDVCLGSVNTGCSAILAGDCNDDDVAFGPEVEERCDGVDNNCDGSVDEDTAVDAPVWYQDADGDGYAVDGASTTIQCDAPVGYGGEQGDCNDGNATIYPGADERCDAIDSDCDGTTDDGDEIDATTWYADADRDGYGDDSTAVVDCEAPSGVLVTVGGDCDDSDASKNPSQVWYPDVDGDGYGDQDASPADCEPDASTDVSNGDDCDDGDADTYPGAEEVRADGVDQDCDGGDVVWVSVSINSNDAACALDSNGGIYCWGDDDEGEVRDAPTDTGHQDIAIGYDHACAIDAAGYATCWGDDSYNQAWPPSTLRFTAIAAGYRSTCGVRADNNRAYCWGYDDDNIVSGSPSYSLVDIDGNGFAYCGLDTTGRVRCWGDGGVLTDPPTDTGFVAMDMGDRAGCMLDASGDISCWGNESDLISDVPSGAKFGPFVEFSAGEQGGCAIDSSDHLLCWGSSSLTSEPSGDFLSVFQSPPGSHTYYQQACAIDTDGLMHCWGYTGNVVSDAP